MYIAIFLLISGIYTSNVVPVPGSSDCSLFLQDPSSDACKRPAVGYQNYDLQTLVGSVNLLMNLDVLEYLIGFEAMRRVGQAGREW